MYVVGTGKEEGTGILCSLGAVHRRFSEADKGHPTYLPSPSFLPFVAIAKALELFMQSLIDEACIETRSKNAKRLTAAHL